MTARSIAPLSLLLTAAALPLVAADTTLRLGPEEFIGGVELRSVQVEHSATRIDDAVLRPYLQGRFFNIGIGVDGFFSIGEDERANVDAGGLTELRFRLDYLIDVPGLLQVLPFFEHNNYIEIEAEENANWLGVDFWYLSPFEGLEFGGNVAIDADKTYGWYGSIGARQFYQNEPLDIHAWQMLSFGDTDYHENYLTGADVSGLSALEIGAIATVPLPWVGTWATIRAEAHFWLQEDDRDALGQSTEIVLGVGFEYRAP